MFNQYKNEYQKIVRAFKQASQLLDINDVSNDNVSDDDIEVFRQEMDNDFNTPNVLTLVQKLVKEINASIRTKDFNLVSIKTNTLKLILSILGLELKYDKLSKEDKELFNNWNKLKAEKNFDEADKLRAKLLERGLL